MDLVRQLVSLSKEILDGAVQEARLSEAESEQLDSWINLRGIALQTVPSSEFRSAALVSSPARDAADPKFLAQENWLDDVLALVTRLYSSADGDACSGGARVGAVALTRYPP
jgi:hypothetical protein